MIKISILVPFKDDGRHRSDVWDWVRRYWESHLPDAEIVVGTDNGRPFSKSCAVNDAASRASGDVFVVMDADACLEPRIIQRCATRAIGSRNPKTWYVPYTLMFRLKRESTQKVLSSDPTTFVPTKPLRRDYITTVTGYYAAALVQIYPRAAFERIGGWDPRYRGWGHEDYAAGAAIDQLWGRRKWTPNHALHLWHGGEGTVHTRVWKGQRLPRANDALMDRYKAARGSSERMQALVDEYALPQKTTIDGLSG